MVLGALKMVLLVRLDGSVGSGAGFVAVNPCLAAFEIRDLAVG